MTGRGEERVEITHCVITPKAYAQFCELCPDQQINTRIVAAMFRGLTIRRQADGSPYWLYDTETLRYVFCIVTVQTKRH